MLCGSYSSCFLPIPLAVLSNTSHNYSMLSFGRLGVGGLLVGGGNAGSSCRWGRTRRRMRCYSQPQQQWDDFMGTVDDLLAADPYVATVADVTETEQPRGAWCSRITTTTSSKSSIEQRSSDHHQQQQQQPLAGLFQPSPVDETIIAGRRIFIKRDDLLRLPGSQISGNKARKMFSLNQIAANQFPKCIVSYGGPQSNSMLALAAVVNYKNRELVDDNEQKKQPIRFMYYTKKLPKSLRKQASGNLFRALTLGMEILELSHKEYRDLFGGDWGGTSDPPMGLAPPSGGTNSLWVPQGGACEMAVEGATMLAQEIVSFWLSKGNNKPLSVILPGGTCSTAVLVHHALSILKLENTDGDLDIQVVVVPSVGDAAYAQRQMMALSASIGASADDIPNVLAPYPDTQKTGETERNNWEYFPFGEPNKAILEVFNLLKEEYGLVVDLIYGAPAWTILMRHFDTPLSPDLTFDPRNPIAGREVMYVHSGGVEGINTQLLRYKYKGLVDLKDIQFP